MARHRRRHGGQGGLRDLQGRSLGAGGSHPLERQQTLRYDRSGRIEQARYSQGNPGLPDETFRYDQAANLLDGGGQASVSPGAGGTSAGYVFNNRLRVYQDKRYDWDEFGRLREKRIGSHTTQRFHYDSEHQLSAIDIDGPKGKSTLHFDYDPLGRRTAKRHIHADGRPIGSTRFLWDGMRMAAEQSGSGQSGSGHMLRLHLYVDEGSYEPLATVEGTGAHQRTLHHHLDANGAPEELTDAQGELLWQVRYKVWGNTVQEEWHRSESTPQNLRFQGQYLDRETGLHYNTFRYYDPDVGRFTTSDPIGLAGGFNLYQYAPNPVGWIDPWGWSCSSNAAKLRRNMNKAGMAAPGYKNSAHHVVMSGSRDWRMVALRAKMKTLKVSINDRRNGVFLPTSTKVKTNAGTGAHAHSRVHTDKYKQNVYDRLKNISNKKDFQKELDKIGREIGNGTFGI